MHHCGYTLTGTVIPAGVSLTSSNSDLNEKSFLLMCAYFAHLRRTCLTMRGVLQHRGHTSLNLQICA